MPTLSPWFNQPSCIWFFILILYCSTIQQSLNLQTSLFILFHFRPNPTKKKTEREKKWKIYVYLVKFWFDWLIECIFIGRRSTINILDNSLEVKLLRNNTVTISASLGKLCLTFRIEYRFIVQALTSIFCKYIKKRFNFSGTF